MISSAKPRTAGAVRAPADVGLPLTCQPRRMAMAAYGLWGSFWAVASLALMAALVPALLRGGLPTAAIFAALGVAAVAMAAMTLPSLLDAFRPGPALVVDDIGFEDRRQKLRLNWSEIALAEIRRDGMGAAAVAFRTREGRGARSRLLHAGPAWRPGDQVVVRLRFLEPSPELAAAAMAGLVERAGGQANGGRS